MGRADKERGIFANLDFNPRNGENNEYEYLLDDELYIEKSLDEFNNILLKKIKKNAFSPFWVIDTYCYLF